MSRSMFAAVALLAICVPASCQVALVDETEAVPGGTMKTGGNPIFKVIELLDGMTKKMEVDAETDAGLKEKLDCWCKKNGLDKEKAIAENTERLKKLYLKKDALAALIAQLTPEIKTHKQDLFTAKNTLDTATQIRKMQLTKFKEIESKMLSSIDAVAKAKKAMDNVATPPPTTGAKPASFLQTSATRPTVNLLAMSQSDVRKLSKNLQQAMDDESELLYTKLSGEQRAVLADFIKDPTGIFLQTSGASEETSPDMVVGVLQSMADDFAGDLKDAMDKEKKDKEGYNELATAKTAEITTLTDAITDKETRKAASEDKLAKTTLNINVTETTLEEDKKFVALVKEKCSNSEAEYQARVKDRSDEMAAVAKAKEILTSDDARDQLRKSYTFFQSSEQSARAKAAANFLAKEGHRLGSEELLSLAMKAKLNGFEKVKQSISDMIGGLKAQQADEAKQRDQCIDNQNKNTLDTEEKTRIKGELQRNIANLYASIKNAVGVIKSINGEMDRLSKELQIASDNRQKENTEFQGLIAEQKATQALLKKAYEVLKKMYAPSLVQIKTRVHIKSHHSSDDEEDDQEDQQATPALGAPEGFKAMKKNSGGAGVLALMEQIIQDSVNLEAEVTKDENDAQKAYESFIERTDSGLKAKQAELAAKNKEKIDAESDLQEKKQSLQSTFTELDALAKTKTDLFEECNWLLTNFDVRQKARGEEMESLASAKAILGGAKFADFLQHMA